MALRRWAVAVALLMLVAPTGTAVAGVASGADEILHQLRSARRQSLRDKTRLHPKSGGTLRSALLVIPVDFADERLPRGWRSTELADRLVPKRDETLRHYFWVASRGHLDLDILIAPVVHLPLARRQYSDRDLNGVSRSRALATGALMATAAAGLDFRLVDNDGLDGRPGTADDDGEVDGVLILHAAAGIENDQTNGLIQPLQFFLDEPVVSRGIRASFYAVASLRSGPGIWAHETGHLLGLEDRYDPVLPGRGGDFSARGGLGRFSLMGAGAWGTGGGFGAALPDAYSAAQLGWYAVRNLTQSTTAPDTIRVGEAARVWHNGELGPEFFLLETRDPSASYPFDAAVPGGHLLIYHIDETLAEGQWRQDGVGRWHLRAGLVEADGDRSLATGENDGGLGDLFPGSENATDFGPFTLPESAAYAGYSSGVSLSGITPVSEGVTCRVSLNPRAEIAFESHFVPTTDGWDLQLAVRELAEPLSQLACEISVASAPAYGVFTGPDSLLVRLTFARSPAGQWLPVQPVTWRLGSSASGTRATRFRYVFVSGQTIVAEDIRWWSWDRGDEALDFRRDWPGQWTVSFPTGDSGTTWHRWSTAPWLTADQSPVLVCTGTNFGTSSLWPDVTYTNNAAVRLTSGLLGPGVLAVRLTETLDAEMLSGRVGIDGAVALWQAADGTAVTAVPVGGYPGLISAHSQHHLHGRESFDGGDFVLQGQMPVWHSATFMLPAEGPEPWRFCLDFAANSQWRARGWMLADVEAVVDTAQTVAFVTRWDGNLHWAWPWRPTSGRFIIQTRPADAEPWVAVLDEIFAAESDGTFSVPGRRLLAQLSQDQRQRHQVRVVGIRDLGRVAGRSVVVYADGGAAAISGLGAPWPNPAPAEVRVMVEVPSGQMLFLRVYDVRGRLVRQLDVGPGRQLAVWDGLRRDGSRAAAGVYFLRLSGAASPTTRRVVLVH